MQIDIEENVQFWFIYLIKIHSIFHQNIFNCCDKQVKLYNKVHVQTGS